MLFGSTSRKRLANMKFKSSVRYVCNETVKTTGGNITNLSSHLETTHSNKYFKVKERLRKKGKKSLPYKQEVS